MTPHPDIGRHDFTSVGGEVIAMARVKTTAEQRAARRAMRAARLAIGLDEEPSDGEIIHPRKVWRHGELMKEPDDFEWLVRGVYSTATWGPIGGLAKTLKSYVSSIFDLSIASGVPAFDHFKVPAARPVKVYIGEGGKAPHIRRMRRLCDRMGLNERDLPIFTQFDVARVDTPRFKYWLVEDLELHHPGRVSIDPLYVYHGQVTTSDLYSRGPMLAELSAPCVERGTSLSVVDHFKKTGRGSGLDQLTQAGMSEWADSWLLLSHRGGGDLLAGKFKLMMEIGSRQWGGALYNLDISLGPFDESRGEFLGEIDWSIKASAVGEEGSQKRDAAYIEMQVLKLLEAEPFEHTKTAVYEFVGGKKAMFDAVWKDLALDGSIVQRGGVRGPWALNWDLRSRPKDPT